MDIRFQNTSGGEWRAACTLVFLPENSTLEACSPALLNQAPWLGIAAFLSVAVLLSLLIFIGEAVRDAFDPNKAV